MPLLVAAMAVLGLTATAALGGSGVGANLNLGQTNSVNAQTILAGSTSAPQLTVKNTSSTSATALSLVVPAGRPPLKVSSATRVPALNADLVDGRDSTYFLPATGSAANSSKLGGLDAGAFFRLRTAPAQNAPATLDGLNAGDVGEFSSATIGADGLGLISYYDAANGDLKVAHCSNVPCSSATKATLDSSGDVGKFSAIAIGADGLGLISYYDATNGDVKVAHCSNVACSSATSANLTPNSNDVGKYGSLTIGADGFGLISHYDATNGTLDVTHCSNLACSSGTTRRLETVSDEGLDTSIATGADGLGLISYYNATNGDLKVDHCSNVACSSATITTIDSAGDVGAGSSITVGADGLGLIAYRNDPGVGLKVAHCSDVTCSSATKTVLSMGYLAYASMTIGADGLGVASYVETVSNALAVAHCADTACSTATTAIIGSAGPTNQYTSTTIGSDGLPLISYVGASTSPTLKAVHCPSAFCAPYFRRR